MILLIVFQQTWACSHLFKSKENRSYAQIKWTQWPIDFLTKSKKPKSEEKSLYGQLHNRKREHF